MWLARRRGRQAAVPHDDGDELIAAVDAVAPFHLLDVVTGGLARDAEDFADLPIGFAGYQPVGDFELAAGQPVVVARSSAIGRRGEGPDGCKAREDIHRDASQSMFRKPSPDQLPLR